MAYIGVSPSNGVRQKHTYTATSGQTTFTGSDNAENVTLSYRDSNYVDVYRNGVKLGDADYTATSGTSVVLGEGAAVNDIVEIVTYDVFSVADTVSKADGGTFDGNVAMAGTLAVTGETTLSTHLNMGDNDIIKVGDGADLQIYHDPSAPGGATNFIKENGGIYTFIQGNTLRLRNRDGSKNYINMVSGAGVDIYYDNAPKLATTSTGIQVAGNIANASGDLTLDVAGNINIDAGGGSIILQEDGVSFGELTDNSGGDFDIKCPTNNSDIRFKGVDGGSTITALRLDMSDAGTAIFNHDVKLATDNAILNIGNGNDIALTHDGTNGSLTSGGNFLLSVSTELTLDAGGDITLDADGEDIRLKDGGTEWGRLTHTGHFGIQNPVSDADIQFFGNDGGATITALTLDMSDAGTAIFNSRVAVGIGSNSAPSLTFSGDLNTGIYRPSSDNLGFAIGGVARAFMSASQFNMAGNGVFSGSITKGSGSFKIDHPLESKKDTHHLVHSFVEAPQADNIYRGKVDLVDGSATVNLDTVSGMTEGTFILLNTNTQCFTSNETGWTAVKGSVSNNILTITAEVSCTDSISWLVVGERHDQHMIDTEWTDDNGKVIVEPTKT